RQRVDREMRVHPEFVEAMANDEAVDLAKFIGELGGHAGIGLDRRAVAGRLEDAAEQHRHLLEARTGALLDARQQAPGEIGVEAAEIVIEDWFVHRLLSSHQGSPAGRRSSSCVQASRGWRWSCQ